MSGSRRHGGHNYGGSRRRGVSRGRYTGRNGSRDRGLRRRLGGRRDRRSSGPLRGGRGYGRGRKGRCHRSGGGGRMLGRHGCCGGGRYMRGCRRQGGGRRRVRGRRRRGSSRRRRVLGGWCRSRGGWRCVLSGRGRSRGGRRVRGRWGRSGARRVGLRCLGIRRRRMRGRLARLLHRGRARLLRLYRLRELQGLRRDGAAAAGDRHRRQDGRGSQKCRACHTNLVPRWIVRRLLIGRIARAKVRRRPLQQCQQHDKTTANRYLSRAAAKTSTFGRASTESLPQFVIRFVCGSGRPRSQANAYA
jgi:hypothetical protein